MGYQPSKTKTSKTKIKHEPPIPSVAVNEQPSEETVRVVHIANEVVKKADNQFMTLGGVIIWLYEQNKTLVRNLTRNANVKRLIELEERIEELEQENRDLKNELVLVKAQL